MDLFCGLGGWTEGLLAEGYRVIGFDIEQHVYGEQSYPAQLVIQDVGGPLGKNVLGRRHGSKSPARKAASAMIAKIPMVLSRHIARTYHPDGS